MTTHAQLPTFPAMPRGIAARPVRFAAPLGRSVRVTAPVLVSGTKIPEFLRKSPAWIDRDL
jgi:hypothetical protein